MTEVDTVVLSALLLFCCNSISGNAVATLVDPATSESRTLAASTEPIAKSGLPRPDAPLPKTIVNPVSKDDPETASLGEVLISPALDAPAKPAINESYETPNQRRAWYGLVIVGHGAAGFDAWTTRRVVGGGYGVEADPLECPFANSAAIYATTQVAPLVMDFLGRRMMRSSHSWIRKAWWVPQTASAGVSLGAGIHNYRIVP